MISISPDGKWLLPGRYGAAKLLAPGGGPDRELAGADPEITWVTGFSTDGARAAGTSTDGDVRIWSTATGENLLRISNGALVSAVRFSADGALFMTGSTDGRIPIWEAATGIDLVNQPAPDDVYGLLLSPDGQRAVATTAGAALLWHPPAASFDPSSCPRSLAAAPTRCATAPWSRPSDRTVRA